MRPLHEIIAINAKDGPKLSQAATVRVDTTHNKVDEPESCDYDPLGLIDVETEHLPQPHREPAKPAWLHRIYFGTGRNAGLAVEKGRDVLEVARTFITARAGVLFRSGFTFSESKGYWQGESEHSFILDIITSRRDQYAIDIVGLAELYKSRFQQDAVIITHTQVWTEII